MFQKAKTEEDVKDIFVELCKFNKVEYKKGDIDLITNDIFFEIKKEPTDPTEMFLQLILKIRDEYNKDGTFEIKQWIVVFDTEKIAILRFENIWQELKLNNDKIGHLLFIERESGNYKSPSSIYHCKNLITELLKIIHLDNKEVIKFEDDLFDNPSKIRDRILYINNNIEKKLKQNDLLFNDLLHWYEYHMRHLFFSKDPTINKNCCIRLLTRLLFVYFLKTKRGIKFPNEIFNRNWTHISLQNNNLYYKTILQNLFHNILNTEIDKRELVNKGNFKDKEFEKFKILVDDIPFVNGGLFDKNEYDVYAEVEDCYVFDLINVLERYDFTLEYNNANGIDTEIIGYLFEKIIGILDNNSGVIDKREESGAFYTPKEIVSYMCLESIKQHLKDKLNINYEPYKIFSNEEKIKIKKCLKQITIIDPACGSGAFPMGILNEIVTIFKNFGDINDTDIYLLKLEIINNIYGVDIEPIAIEITKLRFFLSILLDQKIGRNIVNFKLLPNLDLQFIAANTLIDNTNTNLFYDFEGKQYELLKNEYLKEHTDKEQLKEKIRQIFKDSKWNPFNSIVANDFFNSNLMFNVDSFDLVIGNPPYIINDKKNNLLLSYLKQIEKTKIYEVSKGAKMNIFRLFIALSIEKLCKKNGIVCLIFQNSFLGDNSCSNIRKYMLNNSVITKIDSFPERDNVNKRIFKDVKMSVCILHCKKEIKNNYDFILNVYEEKEMINIQHIIYSKEFINKINQIPLLKENEYKLFNKNYKNIFNLKCYEGEINMTFHKKYLTTNKKNPLVLKGAGCQRYYITDKMSQGILEYLDEKQYLKQNNNKKTEDNKNERIVLQGITGVDDKKRIVATLINGGIYCANSCNYILNEYYFDIKYILGVLNSKYINWLFKKTSTNSNVNCYEINNLPIKKPIKEQENQITSLVSQILTLKKQGQNTDELENQIDELIYEMYELTMEEINIVESGLGKDKI